MEKPELIAWAEVRQHFGVAGPAGWNEEAGSHLRATSSTVERSVPNPTVVLEGIATALQVPAWKRLKKNAGET